MSQHERHDVLVIGSGAAGLAAAIHLAENGHQVAVLSKNDLNSGSTQWAQGGIASAVEQTDSAENHIHDTLIAGVGLCDEASVRKIINHSTHAIDQLVSWGVNFDKIPNLNDYHLTKEGGHSFRRVLHVADSTGNAISNALEQRSKQYSNLSLYTHHVAIDLICTSQGINPDAKSKSQTERCCVGAYVYNLKEERVDVFQAQHVILATGGASKVYLYTSNPDGSTGDGIAMAWRAGCRVANMEFNQFHPTCLYHPHAKSFLISEAVRGEGGVLLLPDGSRFMQRFDERLELAPRDIVARAIDHEMKRLGVDCLYLDISHKPATFISNHFPTIQSRCLDFGIDITRDPMPVVPAAHYTCGGVIVDQNGAADVSNLYVIGESSCTGLHGANRLASNSILECLVYADFAASDIHTQLSANNAHTKTRQSAINIAEWDESRVTDSDEDVVLSHNWDELRRFMWDYVGIVRTQKRLERAMHRINLLKQEVHDYYSNYKVGNDLIELRNLIHVAELIVKSAIRRKESRGLHFTRDYPHTNDNEKVLDTILEPPSKDPLDVFSQRRHI
ncbi:MAG: L-aspartate oxidase [Pseudomonadales bacterium]|nr:L-aspartate oxidase [Pseudomonadales bacterium]